MKRRRRGPATAPLVLAVALALLLPARARAFSAGADGAADLISTSAPVAGLLLLTLSTSAALAAARAARLAHRLAPLPVVAVAGLYAIALLAAFTGDATDHTDALSESEPVAARAPERVWPAPYDPPCGLANGLAIASASAATALSLLLLTAVAAESVTEGPTVPSSSASAPAPAPAPAPPRQLAARRHPFVAVAAVLAAVAATAVLALAIYVLSRARVMDTAAVLRDATPESLSAGGGLVSNTATITSLGTFQLAACSYNTPNNPAVDEGDGTSEGQDGGQVEGQDEGQDEGQGDGQGGGEGVEDGQDDGPPGAEGVGEGSDDTGDAPPTPGTPPAGFFPPLPEESGDVPTSIAPASSSAPAPGLARLEMPPTTRQSDSEVSTTPSTSPPPAVPEALNTDTASPTESAAVESAEFPGRTCRSPPAPYIGIEDCVVARGNTSAGVAGCLTGVSPDTGRPVVTLQELIARLSDKGFKINGSTSLATDRGAVRSATGFALAALITALLAPVLWVVALWIVKKRPSALALWLLTVVTIGPLAIALFSLLQRLDGGPVKDVITLSESGEQSRSIIANPPSVYLISGPGSLTLEMVHVAGATLVAVFAPLLVATLLNNPRDVLNGIGIALERSSGRSKLVKRASTSLVDRSSGLDSRGHDRVESSL